MAAFPISAKSILTAAASINTSYYLLKSAADQILPKTFHAYLSSQLQRVSKRFSSDFTVVIEEFEGLNPNNRFDEANTYLGTIFSLTNRIKVYQPVKGAERDVITVDKGEEVIDSFDGVPIKWVLCSAKAYSTDERGRTKERDQRFFELTFSKKHRDLILNAYLPHIAKISHQVNEQSKVLRLHTYDHDYYLWRSVELTHPASFETVAMEPEAKAELIEDLDRFRSRKDYYRSVGKAWKRGYLLYGPPGTGKSSLIAAMADYLKFDIYDLDLKTVDDNTELKRLLLTSTDKSILVVEDIDCSGLKVEKRKSIEDDKDDDDDSKVTMSGLLNFIDGLWSSCGEARVIVFTTNHKEKLEPALLRPGRMDVHIEMSYCKFGSFKTLARNYLHVEDHELFTDIANLLSEVDVSPADVAGQLMKSNDPDITLEILLKYLTDKKTSESKAANPSQEPEIQQESSAADKTSKLTTFRNKMSKLVKRVGRNKTPK